MQCFRINFPKYLMERPFINFSDILFLGFLRKNCSSLSITHPGIGLMMTASNGCEIIGTRSSYSDCRLTLLSSTPWSQSGRKLVKRQRTIGSIQQRTNATALSGKHFVSFKNIQVQSRHTSEDTNDRGFM